MLSVSAYLQSAVAWASSKIKFYVVVYMATSNISSQATTLPPDFILAVR